MEVVFYQPLTKASLSSADKQIRSVSTILQKAFFPIFPFSDNSALLTLYTFQLVLSPS